RPRAPRAAQHGSLAVGGGGSAPGPARLAPGAARRRRWHDAGAQPAAAPRAPGPTGGRGVRPGLAAEERAVPARGRSADRRSVLVRGSDRRAAGGRRRRARRAGSCGVRDTLWRALMRCRRALPPLLLVLFACRPDPGEVDLVRLLPTAELRTETAEIEVGTPAGRLRLHEGFGRDERAPGPAGGEAGGWVWALGERSRLVFDLLELRPVRLAATGWSAPEPGGSVPTVQASVNGHPIGSFVLPTEETTVELDLPAAALRSGENVLDFDYPPGSTGPVAGIAWRRFRFARLGSAGVPAALANADAIELPWRSAVEFSLESIDGAQLRWSGIQAYGGGAGSLEVVLETDGEPDELLFRGGAGGSGRARLGNPAASGRAAADW